MRETKETRETRATRAIGESEGIGTSIAPACEAIRPQLVAWLDGAVSPGLANALERHLSECAACSAAYREFARILWAEEVPEERPALPDITSAVLARVLPACVRAQAEGLPYLDLRRHPPEAGALECVPAEIARQFAALPVRRDGRNLFVAMLAPRDSAAVDAIRMASRLIVRPMLADTDLLRTAIETAYPKGAAAAEGKAEGEPASPPPPLSETGALIAELRALREEMPLVRGEMGALRQQVAALRAERDAPPTQTAGESSGAGRRLLPFAPPQDAPVFLS